jgi:hypothetical protein
LLLAGQGWSRALAGSQELPSAGPASQTHGGAQVARNGPAGRQARTDLHEAGHVRVMQVCKWTDISVTAMGGAYSYGSARGTPPRIPPADLIAADGRPPLILQPASVRWLAESRALVYLAGEMAVLQLSPRAGGRQPPTVTEDALRLAAALTGPTDAETAALAVAVDDPDGDDDATKFAKLTARMHPGDLTSQATWLDHLTSQARALIGREAAAIRKIAAVLGETGIIGAEAVAEIAEEDRP